MWCFIIYIDPFPSIWVHPIAFSHDFLEYSLARNDGIWYMHTHFNILGFFLEITLIWFMSRRRPTTLHRIPWGDILFIKCEIYNCLILRNQSLSSKTQSGSQIRLCRKVAMGTINHLGHITTMFELIKWFMGWAILDLGGPNIKNIEYVLTWAILVNNLKHNCRLHVVDILKCLILVESIWLPMS